MGIPKLLPFPPPPHAPNAATIRDHLATVLVDTSAPSPTEPLHGPSNIGLYTISSIAAQVNPSSWLG